MQELYYGDRSFIKDKSEIQDNPKDPPNNHLEENNANTQNVITPEI